MAIFEYDDYKAFFREIIKSKGSAGRGEYRKMAEFLNVHPTLISQIFSGPKDLSSEQIVKLAKHYGLGKNESRYLVLLVEIERAGSRDVKEHFVEMKNELQKKSLQLSTRLDAQKSLTDEQKAVFYSSWTYSAIQLLTTLEKPVDFEFIRKRLNLSADRVREVLEFLKERNLIIDENGILKPGLSQTHLGKGSPFLTKHHANWRIKALEKAEVLTDEELMYSANISLSKKDFKKLRESMIEFIQNFLKTVHASPAEDVAQLNLDFFWL